MSQDPCVWCLAEKGLQHDLTLSRKKFKAKSLWWSEMSWQKIPTETGSHWFLLTRELPSRQGSRETELKSLEKQAQMMRAVILDGANLGLNAVQSLLAEQMRLALH